MVRGRATVCRCSTPATRPASTSTSARSAASAPPPLPPPRLRPTHATLPTPRAFPRQPLPRRPRPRCLRSRSRRSPRMDAGGVVAEGVWCGLVASVAAPERAAAEPYLLTPNGWWLRAQVSRDAPPQKPGGYKLGEKVFYTGESKTSRSGDRLVHGMQGEVVGPADGLATKGKGLCVRFPGNTTTSCFLITSVRRLRAAYSSAAIPRLRPTHMRRYPSHARPARPPSRVRTACARSHGPRPNCKRVAAREP
eukprot:scaffold46653_cov64-Phaeocystis_antarctica.AAC.6